MALINYRATPLLMGRQIRTKLSQTKESLVLTKNYLDVLKRTMRERTNRNRILIIDIELIQYL